MLVRCIWKNYSIAYQLKKPPWGVAFDGDADRALLCSASGKIINGDGCFAGRGAFF